MTREGWIFLVLVVVVVVVVEVDDETTTKKCSLLLLLIFVDTLAIVLYCFIIVFVTMGGNL